MAGIPKYVRLQILANPGRPSTWGFAQSGGVGNRKYLKPHLFSNPGRPSMSYGLEILKWKGDELPRGVRVFSSMTTVSSRSLDSRMRPSTSVTNRFCTYCLPKASVRRSARCGFARQPCASPILVMPVLRPTPMVISRRPVMRAPPQPASGALLIWDSHRSRKGLEMLIGRRIS